MIKKINDTIIYVGTDDHDLDLFESQYAVPNGMAYNSYVVLGDKTAVLDTMDKRKTDEWLGNVEEALDDRYPDYLIIQHMEPDHSASIEAFVNKYEDVIVVGNKKTFIMIGQFFPRLDIRNKLVVDNGDELDLGNRKLSFLFAPMVHWPEVMMTYDSTDKILFSADAFGKFGTLDTNEDWACEARRYYTGIVGKYGAQAKSTLKKAAALDIETVCPLHGPVLEGDLEYYMGLYDTWSSYRPETEGVCICYTSVYGNTRKAVELLADKLAAEGVSKVVVNDLARCDMAEAVEDAFRYDRLVLATTTYNSDIFPFMKQFIDHLTERNYQKRTIAFIENGSWAPTALKIMKAGFEKSKDITFAENSVTIKSALDEESEAQLTALAKELAKCSGFRKYDEEQTAEAKSSEKALENDMAEAVVENKGFVCKICGYVYEGEALPADFKCPLCGQGAEQFKPVED